MNPITKLALGQFAINVGDADANIELIIDCMDRASASDADLLVLPEMCTSGLDWAQNKALLPRAEKDLARLTAHAVEKGIAFCGSFLECAGNGEPANTFFYINTQGEVLAKYRKMHLFSLFNENANVAAGNKMVTADNGVFRFGCSICYDLRFPELFRSSMLAGAEVQFLSAAFPHPRLVHWQSLIRARAIENQFYFIAVNQCGTESHMSTGEVSYFGHSLVVDPWGEIVFEAGEAPGLFFVEIDLGLVSRVREQLPALQDRRSDLY